MFLQSSNSRN